MDNSFVFSSIISHFQKAGKCAKCLPLPITGFPLGLNFTFILYAVHDLIFPLVHVQQDIQLIQTSGFIFQLVLSGKRLRNLLFGVLNLNFQIFQLLLVFNLSCRHTFQ